MTLNLFIFTMLVIVTVPLLSAAPAVFPSSNHLTTTMDSFTGNTTLMPEEGELSKRLCEFSRMDGAEQVFGCDKNMPLVSEMVAMMRAGTYWTTSDGRTFFMGALPNNPVLFYTRRPWADLSIPLAQYISMGNMWISLKYGAHMQTYNSANALPGPFLRATARQIREGAYLWTAGGGGGSAASTQDAFDVCFSQALAAAAVYDFAVVLIPHGAAWDADSVWATVELPTLTHNPAINRVMRVDPRASRCAADAPITLNEPEVVWLRGRDQVIPLPRPCPYGEVKRWATDVVTTITVTQ